MKRSIGLALAAGVAVAAFVPENVMAQNRDRDERVRREQRIAEVWRERERDERSTRGPAFCRSGAGHPVHGRQWCRDKGFGLDERDRVDDRRRRDGRYDDRGWEQDRRRDNRRDGRLDRHDPEWRRANWGDIRFRIPDFLAGRELNEQRLGEVIGDRAVGRVSRHAHEIGATGRLVGVWEDDRPLRIRVYAGRVPVAEFIDENQDRRVDIVRLAYY